MPRPRVRWVLWIPEDRQGKNDMFLPGLPRARMCVIQNGKQLIPAFAAQLLNYLKATGIKVGMLVNFKHPKSDIKRFVL